MVVSEAKQIRKVYNSNKAGHLLLLAWYARCKRGGSASNEIPGLRLEQM